MLAVQFFQLFCIFKSSNKKILVVGDSCKCCLSITESKINFSEAWKAFRGPVFLGMIDGSGMVCSVHRNTPSEIPFQSKVGIYILSNHPLFLFFSVLFFCLFLIIAFSFAFCSFAQCQYRAFLESELEGLWEKESWKYREPPGSDSHLMTLSHKDIPLWPREVCREPCGSCRLTFSEASEHLCIRWSLLTTPNSPSIL